MKKHLLRIVFALSALLMSFSAFARVPSFLVGSWTDGDWVIKFTSDHRITVYEDNVKIKEGTFYFEGDFIYTELDVNLKPDYELNLMVLDNYLCHEGGDYLKKVPDNYSQPSDIVKSIVDECAELYDGDIAWAYGVWEIPENHRSGKKVAVKLTPFGYIKVKGIQCSEEDPFADQTMVEYEVKKVYNDLLGTVICIDDIFIDETSKCLYIMEGVDRKIYLTQTDVLVSPLLKTIVWILLVVLALGVLAGVFFAIRAIIRSGIIQKIPLKHVLVVLTVIVVIVFAISTCSKDDDHTDSSVEYYEEDEDSSAEQSSTESSNDNNHQKLNQPDWLFGTWTVPGILYMSLRSSGATVIIVGTQLEFEYEYWVVEDNDLLYDDNILYLVNEGTLLKDLPKFRVNYRTKTLNSYDGHRAIKIR